MIIFQYVNKFLAFHVNQNLITKFTRACHWNFPWAIQSKSSLLTSGTHILILFIHLCRIFQYVVWISSLPTDILLVFFSFPQSNYVTEPYTTFKFLQTANKILLWNRDKSFSDPDTLTVIRFLWRPSKLWTE